MVADEADTVNIEMPELHRQVQTDSPPVISADPQTAVDTLIGPQILGNRGERVPADSQLKGIGTKDLFRKVSANGFDLRSLKDPVTRRDASRIRQRRRRSGTKIFDKLS